MTYTEAMRALNNAAYDAVRAALNEDGAPVDDLKKLARDIDYLVNFGVTYAEFCSQKTLYEGAKTAGLTS